MVVRQETTVMLVVATTVKLCIPVKAEILCRILVASYIVETLPVSN